MKLSRIAALAALAFAFAPAARLDGQTATGSTPRTEAHAAHHGRHAQHATAGHGAHQGHHARGGQGMGCDHGAGGHAATPAMLLMHRADLGLSEGQAQRLGALRQDDAAGAQAVLTAEQRTRMQAVHAAMAGAHQAHGGAHAHGSCADCCKDGGCGGEGCCRESDCCTDGRCDDAKCRECCARMSAAAKGAPAPRS